MNSAFIGTDLDLRLKRLGAKHVVAFGISTDMCVSTTVRTGSNMGWDMILVPDASDCFDLPDGQGGTIAAEDVQRAHVATLGLRIRADHEHGGADRFAGCSLGSAKRLVFARKFR